MRLRGAGLLKSRGAIVIVVVILAAGTGVGLWLGLRSPVSAATTLTQIVTAQLGTIQQTASATGTIEPATQSDVNFDVSGKVTAVDVSVGQTVTQGQTLATIDNTSLTTSLAGATETLDAAEAKLSSDQSSNAPAAQITSDQAAVTAAQNQVDSAKQLVDEATLTAPIAGTVASLSLTVGQEVSGGSGGGGNGGSAASSGSSAEVVIINTSAWLVNATVNDSTIGEIAQGDQAQIAPQGSATTVYGTVATIGLIASQSSGVASFPVTINVTGDPSGLYSGTSANVIIIVKQLTNVLAVPVAALHFSGGTTSVEVVRNGKDEVQPVTVGASSGGEVQITSGLEAGEQVVETIVRSSTPRSTVGGTGRTGFGGAGFGGGGFGGGGFGGGGLGGGG